MNLSAWLCDDRLRNKPVPLATDVQETGDHSDELGRIITRSTSTRPLAGHVAGDGQVRQAAAAMNLKRLMEGLQELRALWLGKRAKAAGISGDLEESERLTRKALAIMERALGDVEQTAIYVFNLADVLAAQGRFPEAEPNYRRAFAMDETDLGSNHPRHIAWFLFVAPRFASVLRELGHGTQARELEAPAAAIESARRVP